VDRRKESGQAIIEYIILLTIVFGTVAYFVQKLTGGFDSMVASSGAKVEKQLRTGAAPATIWNK
jgi:hypothetical protein